MIKSIDVLLQSIKERYENLPENDELKESFVSHLESLSQFSCEPFNYDECQNVDFPKEIFVAYAVCHPECGVKEFIVDGSTQRCQLCGGTMFRTEVMKYELAN